MNVFRLVTTFAAEFVGTCALTFTAIGIAMGVEVTTQGVTGSSDVLTVAAGFGGIVAAMVAAFGSVSGAHLNPAVTAGLAVGGWVPLLQVPVYMVAQLLGGLVGVALLKGFVPSGYHGSYGVNAPMGISSADAIIMEMLATAVLSYTVVLVCNHPETKDMAPVTAPVAIGTVVFLDHLLLIPFTGCSINPARSFGAAVVAEDLHHLWIFLLGPTAGGIIGGALGAAVLKLQSLENEINADTQ